MLPGPWSIRCTDRLSPPDAQPWARVPEPSIAGRAVAPADPPVRQRPRPAVARHGAAPVPHSARPLRLRWTGATPAGSGPGRGRWAAANCATSRHTSSIEGVGAAPVETGQPPQQPRRRPPGHAAGQKVVLVGGEGLRRRATARRLAQIGLHRAVELEWQGWGGAPAHQGTSSVAFPDRAMAIGVEPRCTLSPQHITAYRIGDRTGTTSRAAVRPRAPRGVASAERSRRGSHVDQHTGGRSTRRRARPSAGRRAGSVRLLVSRYRTARSRYGQAGTAKRLPVMTTVSGHSRFAGAVLIPRG